MAICRYFLKGTCHFGQNCRFEHVYDDPSVRESGQHRNPHSQYHYSHTLQQSNATFNFGNAVMELATQKTQEIDQMKRELQHIIDGRLYPFTVIPGASPQMNFKHLSDLSPEEIRLKAYESLAANRFEEHQSDMSKYLSHVIQIVRQIVANPHLLQESQAKPSSGHVVFDNDLGINSMGLKLSHQDSLGCKVPRIVQNALHISASPNFSTHNVCFSDQQSNAIRFEDRITQGSTTRMDPTIHQSALADQNSSFSREVVSPGHCATLDLSNKQQANEATYTQMELLSADDLTAFRDRVFTLDNLPLVAPPKELC